MPLQRFVFAAVAAFVAVWLGAAPAGAAPGTVTYTLGPKAVVQTLYPDASWLPPPYAAKYPDLAATIKRFTEQSLGRDGVKGGTATVSFPQVGGVEQVQLTIRPANAVTRQYAKLHPAMLDSTRAQAALRGAAACKADASSPKCWDRQPIEGRPWAFFLPLGMAMVTQKSLMLLDYPPYTALLAGDYLNNLTMCRWTKVMGAAGAADPIPFETIVDVRPIAATGSGQDLLLPNPSVWFNSKDKSDAVYLAPMLALLSTPASAGAARTRPVGVFGGTPRATWANIVGKPSLDVLDVGESKLPGTRRTTPWITTNHPDVTVYQCCSNDPQSTYCDAGKDLIADEQIDFIAACWLQTMTGPNPPSPAAAKASCTARWSTAMAPKDKQSLCVQAKLDNHNRDAQCGTYEDAWNYCAANNGDACASFACKFDPAKVTLPLPPEGQRPAGWKLSC